MARTWHLKDAGLMVETVGKEAKQAVSAGLLSAAYRLVQSIVADIIPSLPRPPVDRGLYRSGWRAGKMGGGAFVENTAPHAPIIEWGARAGNIKIGRAMIEALAAWVRRKGIGSRTVTSSKGGRDASGKFVGAGTRRVKASQKEAEAIAWAIAKSMQKKGIFPPNGLRVLEKASKRIPRFIDEEVTKKLKEAGLSSK